MKIASTAFANDGMIPAKFTCDGADISPPLQWNDVPANAKTLALICDDPDAPRKTFTHWLLFDRPATTDALP
jgi:Raf kinase inhibitor-like YbhB/YbcL family protein